MKEKVYNDTEYIMYLLDLFEGRVTLDDIMEKYNIPFIMSLREKKEEQLSKRSESLRRAADNKVKPIDGIEPEESRPFLAPII